MAFHRLRTPIVTCAVCVVFFAATLGAQTIVTIAGGGTDEGRPALASGLISPRALAVDAAGNLYIAETLKNRVRRVDAATGTVTTLAGDASTPGFSGDNGPATQAGLNNPFGVAVDGSRNVYIADTFNGRIRKVAASTGVITTVAQLSAETLAVDFAGNLYVPDSNGNRVVKVAAATGAITTVAGNGSDTFSGDNGPATGAGLRRPFAVNLDSSGNLFIVDFGNRRIRRVDAATGIITTVAGNGSIAYSGDNGLATAAGLDSPVGVAVDSSGNLFIADQNVHRIRRVDAITGVITTVAGNGSQGYSGDEGSATAASLNFPHGVAVDASRNLYLVDMGNHRIRKVTAGSGVITTAVGGASGDNGPATAAVLNGPTAVAVDAANNVYIVDTGIARIAKVAAGTGFITTLAGGAGGFLGDNGPAVGAGLSPRAVAVDRFANIYIADSFNRRIRRVDATTGIITTVAGNGSATFSGDNGPATAAGVSNPTGVSVDAAGNVYFADTFHQRVRKIAAATGIITTVAGGGADGGDNGPRPART